jgi:signal transduction histidine kinase
MNSWLAIIKTFLLFSSQILSGLSICYIWLNGRRTPVAYYFIRIHFLLIIWIGLELLCYYITDCQTQWLCAQLEYGAISLIGICWLLFCLNYVKRTSLNRRNQIFLAIPPVLSYGILLVNNWLLIGSGNSNRFGMFFYIFVFIIFLYGIAGNGLLVAYVIKRPEYRQQIYWIIMASLAPLITGMMFTTKAIDWNGFNFTILSFNISSSCFLIGIIKYRLVDIVPIALQNILAQMKEVVIVIDQNDRIIDYNQAFITALQKFAKVQPGELLQVVLETLQQQQEITVINKVTSADSDSQYPMEIYLRQVGRWYSVNIQPIATKNLILGQIITLNDITEYKNLLAELHQKNTELTLLNRQLQEQATTIAELATVKERNRVVQDIHDTLGQTMTLLLTTLQLCKLQWRDNSAAAEVKLDHAIKFADKALRQTRQALYGLTPAYDDAEFLSGLLPELINEFAASGMKVQLHNDGNEYPVNERAAQIIYHLCQEALTNALRHAKTEHLMISLNFTPAQLILEIRDDGLGCVNFKAGIGLRGMERRIKSLNGQINFVSHPNAGFMILAEIPKTQLLPGAVF